MFVGQSDILGDTKDAQWTAFEIGSALAHY